MEAPNSGWQNCPTSLCPWMTSPSGPQTLQDCHKSEITFSLKSKHSGCLCCRNLACTWLHIVSHNIHRTILLGEDNFHCIDGKKIGCTCLRELNLSIAGQPIIKVKHLLSTCYMQVMSLNLGDKKLYKMQPPYLQSFQFSWEAEQLDKWRDKQQCSVNTWHGQNLVVTEIGIHAYRFISSIVSSLYSLMKM